MRERPILFSGEMVRAILDGRKTQTRRVAKLPDDGSEWRRGDLRNDIGEGCIFVRSSDPGGPHGGAPESCWIRCPYGQRGDRLWVRETWALPPAYCPDRHGDLRSKPRIGPVCFRSGYSSWDPWPGTRWRPSIHMPRWASRLTLEVTGVRVERLQEISEEDARAEGVRATDAAYVVGPDGYHKPELDLTHRGAFAALWDDINAKRGHGWVSNPWVWAIEFRRLRLGEDLAGVLTADRARELLEDSEED